MLLWYKPLVSPILGDCIHLADPVHNCTVLQSSVVPARDDSPRLQRCDCKLANRQEMLTLSESERQTETESVSL